MKCTQCGYDNDHDAEYCEHCGDVLKKTCPQCGSPVKLGAAFCKKCGTRLLNPAPSPEKPSDLETWQPADPAQQKENHPDVKVLEGERKLVTILFVDIVGSTAYAEKLDPEEWKEIVAGAHRIGSLAIYHYEGTLAQLLGDGVLAFFGAPVTHEDDPLRAVRAALEIQAALPDYRRKLAGLVENFQVRIGIHTGTVVAGPIGDDRHMEYLAVGDAVNLAARLQSAANPGSVLISETTARLVSASFELHSMGAIIVKGKSEPVSAFEVMRGKAVQESQRGFEELRSPLVGRGQELHLMHTALEALMSGHGQVLTVFGEAGIGKSRLVEEVCRSVAGSPDRLYWIEGRAFSYGQGFPFSLITQLLYSDLGLSEGNSEIRIRAALKKRIFELFGEQSAEIMPYLLHLVSVRLEEEQALQINMLEGETLRHQIFRSLSTYFEHMARQKPVVMVFEDLHWADPSSLEAIERLLALTDRAPLMLMLVARMERDQSWWKIKLKAETDFAHRYTEILIKPLSGEEQNQLVDNLLMLSDLPMAVRQMILDRSEGNPFYLEEIIRSLIEQDRIYYQNGVWQTAKDLGDTFLPATLQGILQARIDRLPERARRTLQLAAVIGKTFPYRLLKAVAGDEAELDQHLAQLQRLDLIREKSHQPELEYIFKHSLTQEATYQSLLVERRREFHQQVGRLLEEIYADRKEQYLGLLAHHFTASGDTKRAIDYLVQAGDQTRLADEHSEAITYYQHAIQLLLDLPDEARAAQVWFKLGLIYSANFEFEASHQAYETAFRLQQSIPVVKRSVGSSHAVNLRVSLSYPFRLLDPGLTNLFEDAVLIMQLFSGLAKLNEDLDVVPEIARSWQVLDSGRRYVFYLRDDFTWSNGTPVTAADFEWAWKRNLDPANRAPAAENLFVITGARNYHLGINPDPEQVGVHALDAYTLEVLLIEPVAFFPFLLTLPITLPLPREAVERYGPDWWQPGRIVSNGPFQLLDFVPENSCIMEQSEVYPGQVEGNISRIEWKVITEPEERLRAYQENRLDISDIPNFLLPPEFPKQEVLPSPALQGFYAVFNLNTPPLDDQRVRKAFVHALDRQAIYNRYQRPSARGGLVPPGMPGHSPDIGLVYNPELGRKYLAESGYPGGQGFPTLTAVATHRFIQFYADEYTRQWRENLGVEVQFQVADRVETEDLRMNRIQADIYFYGWLADYPDPNNFLGQGEMLMMLHYLGWRNAAYDRLIEEAARVNDRGKRLQMYRQADTILVHDQALILPITYGTSFKTRFLFKPWVKHFRPNVLGNLVYQNITIDVHN